MPNKLTNNATVFVLCLGLGCFLLLFSGCGSGSATSHSNGQEIGASFILASTPKSFTTIGMAQGKTAPDETTTDETTTDETTTDEIETPQSVTVKGWVDLKALEGKKDTAVFMLREIIDDGHGGKSHDPSSCPYCKRRMNAAPKAVVAFKEDNGEVINNSVEDLFPIEHGDIVIVKGIANHDKEFNLLELNASGIFFVEN